MNLKLNDILTKDHNHHNIIRAWPSLCHYVTKCHIRKNNQKKNHTVYMVKAFRQKSQLNGINHQRIMEPLGFSFSFYFEMGMNYEVIITSEYQSTSAKKKNGTGISARAFSFILPVCFVSLFILLDIRRI